MICSPLPTVKITRDFLIHSKTCPQTVRTAWCCLIIGLLITSCTSGPALTRFLVDEPDKTVGMEVTYREGSSHYSHPRNLNANILDQALQSIEAQPASLLNRITGGSSIHQEAFLQEQREFLAKHVSTAFQKATPLETVTFYWATQRGNGIWEITSGGLYLQENNLHIVLPNYRETFSAKNLPQQIRKTPLSRMGESRYSLKAIDPARQLTQDLVSELWEPQIPHFVFSLKELAKGSLASSHRQTHSSNPSQNTGESIKKRLQRLDELRNEQFLSEKEYQHKRQEILKEL